MAHQNPTMMASVTSLSPEPERLKEPVDTLPSDKQPPGVDEEIDLETALTSL